MRDMTQEEREFLQDFLTITAENSQDKDFTVEYELDEYFVVTSEGEVELNPNQNIDVEYNKAIARQSNNDRDKELYNKALEKQRKENEKDLILYNKALEKQQAKRRRIEQKRKETGLKLV